MFDTIVLKCPSCESELDVQTKSGPNCMDTYTADDVPIDIALGAIGHPVYCEKCDNEFRVKPTTKIPKTVSLKLETE
jgi:hypothetical protein